MWYLAKVCATLVQGMQGPWSHFSPMTAPVNERQSALAAMDQVQHMSTKCAHPVSGFASGSTILQYALHRQHGQEPQPRAMTCATDTCDNTGQLCVLQQGRTWSQMAS